MAHEEKIFELPLFVVGPADIVRLRREIEALDEYLEQARLRQAGEDSPKLPKTSRGLDELAKVNNLNLLQGNERLQVRVFLDKLLKSAPVAHISFAADPSAAFSAKIVQWFRGNIHPHLLLHVGLQPGIGAGCVLRTPNRQFDLSLSRKFADKGPLIIEKLKGETVNVGQ